MAFNSTDKPVAASLTVGTLTVGSVGQGTPNTFTSAWPVKITDGTQVATTKQLQTQVVSADVGVVVNAILHGYNTVGGTYVDILAQPSGLLKVSASQDTSTSPWSVSGVGGVSGAVCGVVSVSGAVSGVQSISGTVSVAQTGSPWGVSGSVSVTNALSGVVSVSGTANVAQTGSPWGVSGSVSVTNALSATVSVSGAVSGVQSISGTVNVAQTGSPWGVSGTVIANQGTASATAWPVFISQVVSATITGFVSVSNTVTVTGNVSVSGIASVSGTVSLSGTVGVNQGAASSSAGWPVFLGGASAASGYQMYQNTALSNTVVNVKASSGNVYGYHFKNDNDLDCYIQFFKVTAASVTLSSTVAVRTIGIPGGGGIIDSVPGPLAFVSGIAIAATISKSGSTAMSSAILAIVDYY